MGYKDGHYTLPKYPKINTTNGLTTYITQFLKYEGHHSERTNTMGVPVVKNGKVTWRKSGATNGSSDIKAFIKNPKFQFPIPVTIEIKFGKDKQSDDQKKYEKSVRQTGAFYEIVHDLQDFFALYEKLITLEPQAIAG